MHDNINCDVETQGASLSDDTLLVIDNLHLHNDHCLLMYISYQDKIIIPDLFYSNTLLESLLQLKSFFGMTGQSSYPNLDFIIGVNKNELLNFLHLLISSSFLYCGCWCLMLC